VSAIGNTLWVILGGGAILFVLYLFGGVILCLTIIGIPFGVQCIKLSLLALLPFGKEVISTKSASGCVSTTLNIVWIIVAGLAIALVHAVIGLLCAITVIGIPFAKQHLKLAAFALTPFGRTFK